MKNFAVIILAAGLGKRMKSETPKVLHKVGEKPIIIRSLEVVEAIAPEEIIVVTSPTNNELIKSEVGQSSLLAVQQSPKGTADAAAAGLKETREGIENVVILYGDDTAFYRPATITEVIKDHEENKNDITFVTLDSEKPTGLGRIVREGGKVKTIVEEKDATEAEKKITEINDGIYVFNRDWIQENIGKLEPSGATGELYITDLISMALSQNKKVDAYKLDDQSQWHGINTPEELEAAANKNQLKIHIMGAAGAGAAAVAGIAAENGFDVSGCDLNPDSAYTQNLKVKIEKGHSPEHLKDIGILITSPAVEKLDPDNEEIKAAREQNIPVMSWQEFQGKYLQRGKFVITVAGAYGKSTTTAMIAKILTDAGVDPTVEIGAKVIEWGANFRVGKSKYYVCESDEYNNNFLHYKPDIAVILNLNWDHPDFFKSKGDVVSAYQKFVSQIKIGGRLITSNETLFKDLVPYTSARTEEVTDFGDLNLSIIGDFRKENANAALTVAEILGLNITQAVKSVESFKGLGRRLEEKGRVGNAIVYDDYAVQPYTIKSTADALADKYPDKKVTLVLEPHTFSRINTFFEDFVKSLKESKVHEILITEVYAAREKGDKIVLSKKLAEAVGTKAKFTGSVEETALYIKKDINTYDVILSMGAGNSYMLYDLLKS
ncbi:MAG: sugar phosphate nucleotidyltransferase [Candidatus Curtissbacteria bacterium]|nr:sugar phosphate nucleotidyltransferase [Candidatus Curtissbacteria bacterium]